MVRRLLLSLSAAAALLLAMLLSVPALAGGGCYGQGVLEGTGNTVEMSRMCFSPMILRVQPGETVTFVNRDGLDHVVTGAAMAWGDFTQIKAGAALRNRFMAPGIYPYTCKLHYGMTGAIVVGDGLAAGQANLVNAKTVNAAREPANGSIPWPAVALAAALAGVGLGYGVARFRGARKVL